VIGKVLEDLSSKYASLGSPAAWLIRIGQVAVSIVNMSMPGSFLQILAQHWFKLLYVAEALLIVVGILLAQKEVSNAGWISLGVTLGLHLLILALSGFLSGDQKK
jgi:hypothetical protein